MFSQNIACLFGMITYCNLFCMADLPLPEHSYVNPEESIFPLNTSLLSGVVAKSLKRAGLSALTSVLQELKVSSLLASDAQLADVIHQFPTLLSSNSLNAYELLFKDVGTITRQLQGLIENGPTCETCIFIVGLIKFLILVYASDDFIVDTVVEACILYNILTRRVCAGGMENQRTMILYAARKTPYTILEICAILIGKGCGIEPARYQWKVPVPGNKPPLTPVSEPQTDARVLKILHMSDIHIDRKYEAGTPSDCGEPLCCRTDSPDASTEKMTAGPYGGLIYCDLPVRTLEIMFQDAKDRYPDPEFIFFTGDLPVHDVWTGTREGHMTDNEIVIGLLKKFFPETQVYPAIGNHDSSPMNNFPMHTSQIPKEHHVNWMYEKMAHFWSSWLTPDALNTVKRGGYYSTETKFPGLRIISLNNNICLFLNFWLMINSTDPFDQLKWLVEELTAAESKEEKVIILMHIPSGSDECLKIWSSNYYDIVNRFENIIVGQHSGHTHVDSFSVFYDRETGRPTNVIYTCPSMTSHKNFNPAYRAIHIDGTSSGSYAMLDHFTYIMHLEHSNANKEPEFELLYSASDAYDMSSMQPSEWDNVISKITEDNVYWERFFAYYHRNSSVFPPCNEACKKRLICQLKSARSRDESQC